MRLPITPAAVLLNLITGGFVSAKPPAPPTDLQRFFGGIQAIDRSARTVTIEIPMRFVFHVRETTKITDGRGAPLTFDKISTGTAIDVVARHGAGNTWTALTIKVERGVRFAEFATGKTVHGQTVTEPELNAFITYRPPGELINRNIDIGETYGLFLMTVRPDGTVASVRTLRSMNYAELNEQASRWLMKYKFKPNSLTEVRVPMGYKSFRHY
jgi:hypothetical protein